MTPSIRVMPIPYNNQVGSSYQQAMEQALEAGNAPDLMQFGSGKLPAFAARGYLTPLDECTQRYSAFADILEPAWHFVTWQEKIWAVPFRVGMVLFYFNKLKLQALGWTNKEIDELPGLIERGEFTLDDLVAVARQAIMAGVVKPGFGYWPYLDDPWTLSLNYLAYGGRIFDAQTNKWIINKTALTQAYAFHRQLFTTGITHPSFTKLDHSFFDKTMWEDAVVHGRVLFWVGISANWALLTTEYRDDLAPGVDPQVMLGYALYPSSTRGQPGQVFWESGTAYVIPSEKASGRRNQAAACALLAQTLTPEINALHVARNGYMSILQAQATHTAFQDNHFNRALFQMWPYAIMLPRQHAEHDSYTAILNSYLDGVQTGELPVEVAAELAILQLRRQLGDALLVE